MNLINKKILEEYYKTIMKIFIKPSAVFRNYGKNEYIELNLIGFIGAGLITLFKSFGINNSLLNFYTNEYFNSILTVFSIPQFQWLINYTAYFLFVYVLSVISSKMIKGSNRRIWMCFLLINYVGIFLHIIGYLIEQVAVNEYYKIFKYLAFLWVILLEILAFKISLQTTYIKSMIIYLIIALPIVLFIGLTGIAPFLLWL